nr:hypothetical protein DBT46_07565 [Aerococcus mictus]
MNRKDSETKTIMNFELILIPSHSKKGRVGITQLGHSVYLLFIIFINPNNISAKPNIILKRGLDTV